MRKTSAYARKRRARGLPADSAALTSIDYQQWQHTIKVRQSYEDSGLTDVALASTNRVRVALAKLLDHGVPPDDTEPHDLLAHAFGVATIRAINDHGGIDGNRAIPPLDEACNALRRVKARRLSTGQWGVDGPGREALKAGVEWYETITLTSSPAQMERASRARIDILTGKRRDPRITT